MVSVRFLFFFMFLDVIQWRILERDASKYTLSSMLSIHCLSYLTAVCPLRSASRHLSRHIIQKPVLPSPPPLLTPRPLPTQETFAISDVLGVGVAIVLAAWLSCAALQISSAFLSAMAFVLCYACLAAVVRRRAQGSLYTTIVVGRVIVVSLLLPISLTRFIRRTLT